MAFMLAFPQVHPLCPRVVAGFSGKQSGTARNSLQFAKT